MTAAAAPTAAVAAAAASVGFAALWATGAGLLVDLPFVPSVGSRLVLGLDGLSAPLVVFATGIAAPVFAYTAAYLPRHLDKEGRKRGEIVPFVLLMLGFMLAMVLLILARDLLVIFLALELTALASFFLIRFDAEKPEARRAAITALVVTGGSSLVFLVGVLVVAGHAGSTEFSVLTADGAAERIPAAGVACLIFGALGKSAQVPLHFWLPRAMVAPTPVSAYLHSAALVAAGVFVLQRLRFLLEASPALLEAAIWLGFLSIGIGALLALVSDEFKRILAYSTVAQYGYAMVLIGVGGEHGAVGAAFFLVAHGIAKCALFLTAGAVTVANGEARLSQSGGLARPMPLLAAGSAVAAAGLAGLPLTIGFFKDDLLVKAGLDHGALAAGLAGIALALTVAYTARFWFGIFGGARRASPGVPASLSLPVAALAALVLCGGLWPGALEPAFADAGSAIAQEPSTAHLAYAFEPGPALWLTLSAWAAGAALAAGSGRLSRRLSAPVGSVAAWLGPDVWASRLAAGGAALSDRLHRMEVRDMRDRLTAILVPTAAFVLLGLFAQDRWPTVQMPDSGSVPLIAALSVTAVSAVAVATPLSHFAFVLLLSFVGFSLALAFSLAFAPAVALVLVLIETTFTLLFLAVLSRIRPHVLAKALDRVGTGHGPLPGILAGVVGTAAAWLALSVPRDETMAASFVELTGRVHAKDVVTAILADFRGLDTAVELTVLVVAIFGAAAIVWGRQS